MSSTIERLAAVINPKSSSPQITRSTRAKSVTRFFVRLLAIVLIVLSLAIVLGLRWGNVTYYWYHPLVNAYSIAIAGLMELADKLLAKLGMTALVFVDINKLDEGNINLVSWHKLEQMVKSGRWEVGISGCLNGDNPVNYSPMQLAEKLAQRRKNLEQHLKVAVIAADCPYSWGLEKGEGETVWNQALNKAGFKIGFTTAPYGANYKEDHQFGLR